MKKLVNGIILGLIMLTPALGQQTTPVEEKLGLIIAQLIVSNAKLTQLNLELQKKLGELENKGAAQPKDEKTNPSKGE
jgi:hypothetical protein